MTAHDNACQDQPLQDADSHQQEGQHDLGNAALGAPVTNRLRIGGERIKDRILRATQSVWEVALNTVMWLVPSGQPVSRS